MGRFFIRDGAYFEAITDIPTPEGAIEVPQRPDPAATWSGAAWVAGEVAPDPVPDVVSRFQAKAALAQAGLLDAAEAAVAQADAFTRLAWAEVVEFYRDSPAIAALGAQMGLTDAQIDDLFRVAATIRA